MGHPVIVDAARTPYGKRGGARADERGGERLDDVGRLTFERVEPRRVADAREREGAMPCRHGMANL